MKQIKNIVLFCCTYIVTINVSIGQLTNEQQKIIYSFAKKQNDKKILKDTICVLNKNNDEIIDFIHETGEDFVINNKESVVYYQCNGKIEKLDSIKTIKRKGSYYYCESFSNKKYLLNRKFYIEIFQLFPYSFKEDLFFVRETTLSKWRILYKNKLSSNSFGSPYYSYEGSPESDFTIVILNSKKSTKKHRVYTNAVINYKGEIISIRDSIRKSYGFMYKNRAIVVKGMKYFYVDKKFTTRSPYYDYIYSNFSFKYTLGRIGNEYFIIQNYDGVKKKKINNIKYIIGSHNNWFIYLSTDNNVIFQSFSRYQKMVVFEKTDILYQILNTKFSIKKKLWNDSSN